MAVPRAAFYADDPQHIVDAAFACPRCDTGQAGIPRLMGSARRWSSESYAHCRCTSCYATWVMQLDLLQTLRLTAIRPLTQAEEAAISDLFGPGTRHIPFGNHEWEAGQ